MMTRTMMVLILLALTRSVGAQEDDLPVIQSRPIVTPAKAAPPEEEGFVPPPNIVAGVAEARLGRTGRVRKTAENLSESGAAAVRVAVDDITWGRMQPSSKKRIDFDDLDTFVREYQAAGFRELVVPLSSRSEWASVDCGKSGCANQTPKPEYLDRYAAWVTAVVERYDRDGVADMQDLRFPVRFFEIGESFTAVEPGPVDDYLQMLGAAHAAAHSANPGVVVAHAALVTTSAFASDPAGDQLDVAFAAASRLIHHSLADIRALLDAHESFDVVNLHALSNPDELEASLKWVRTEMESRGIEKPIIITRATPSPFITGGAASTCTLNPDRMGVMVPPAVEEDRCRLAGLFNLLLKKNQLALTWLHKVAAADLIKKVLVAAEQDVILINAGVLEDDEDAQSKKRLAADGTTPWVGMIGDKQLRPAYLALDQVTRLIRGYSEVRRLPTADPRIHVYRVKRKRGMMYVAWATPENLMLPGDGSLRMEVDLPVESANIVVERMITRVGQINPPRQFLIPRKGIATVTLTPQPAFIFGAY